MEIEKGRNEEETSPVILKEVILGDSVVEEEKKKEHVEGYDTSRLFYDKISRRIIYFDLENGKIMLYNRSNTEKKKEMKMKLDYEIKRVAVDPDTNYLLVLGLMMKKYDFLFVLNVNKEIVNYEVKEEYEDILDLFFIERNLFCVLCINKISLYYINTSLDEINLIKAIDYKKVLITNFSFVREYHLIILYKDDNTFDIITVSKTELSYVKTFSNFFDTKSSEFKRAGTFSKLFSSNKESQEEKYARIINTYNNKYNNAFRKSQYFFEFIYENLYMIFFSFEDDKIFFMQIESIQKFPKIEDGNKIFHISFKLHSNNSTLQFLDNLIFIHNFETLQSILLDLKNRQNKVIKITHQLLKHFDLNNHPNIMKIGVFGGNFITLSQYNREYIDEDNIKQTKKVIRKKIFAVQIIIANFFFNYSKNKKKEEEKTENIINLNPITNIISIDNNKTVNTDVKDIKENSENKEINPNSEIKEFNENKENSETKENKETTENSEKKENKENKGADSPHESQKRLMIVLKDSKHKKGELENILMISRRSKSKEFFLSIIKKIISEINFKNRTQLVCKLLNEFSRQINKNETVANRVMEANLKKTVDKFQLDTKYLMLTQTNSISQIEVMRLFRQIGTETNKQEDESRYIYDLIYFLMYFANKVEEQENKVLPMFDEIIISLLQKVKKEEDMIKILQCFSFGSKFFFRDNIAKYLLDNFKHPYIRHKGYIILVILEKDEDLFYYLFKNEKIPFIANFISYNKNILNLSTLKNSLIQLYGKYDLNSKQYLIKIRDFLIEINKNKICDNYEN